MRANVSSQRRNSMRSSYRGLAGGRDRGERFVVLYRDGLGTERTFGFANDRLTVARYVKRIGHNPAWRYTRTVDRGVA